MADNSPSSGAPGASQPSSTPATPDLHQGAITNETAQANAADEVDGDLSAEQVADPTPQQIASQKKKYQLKVNNKSKEIELDLNDDKEVQRYLQRAFAADEKFEEAAMTRKQAEALVDMLRKDPLSILRHPELGIDVKALAQKVINEEIEDMNKSPEQKKMEEMEKKLKQYETDKKKSEEDRRQAEKDKYDLEQAQVLDDQITSALSQTTLPKSAYTVKRIADAMIEAVNMGYEDVTPEQVLPFVEQSVRREIAEMFGALPDAAMEEILGKGRLDSFRKARLDKAKKAPVNNAKSVKDTGAAATKDTKPKDEKKVRFKDVFGAF